MVFTSHIFLFYFLPLCLLCYYVLWPRRWRNGVLTAASYLFYGWWKPWFVALMMTSTAVDYTAGRALVAPGATARRRRLALLASVGANLGLLAVFKYAVFAQQNVNELLALLGRDGFRVLEITLPIGISFYTFQTMSYTIDVYRGVAPPVQRLGDFSCFVALFPQLIAGPIVRYNTIAEQLARRRHTLERFSQGVALFIVGFTKKIVLANPMGEVADAVFAAQQPGALAAWYGVTAYAFQIYFDFSGYSDMAIGLGRMFGFELPKNFDSPYHSRSITEFWRRWHISLSSFLRDYLYVPLGGNRLGPRRTYANLAAVMLLGGLWHGARWQFVAWGAFHGVLLAAERAIGRRSPYAWLPGPGQVALTFALVLLSWVLFRADDLGRAADYLAAMFGLAPAAATASLLGARIHATHSLTLMALCALVVSRRTQSWDLCQRLDAPRVAALAGCLALSLAAMFTQAFNPFLYFQF